MRTVFAGNENVSSVTGAPVEGFVTERLQSILAFESPLLPLYTSLGTAASGVEIRALMSLAAPSSAALAFACEPKKLPFARSYEKSSCSCSAQLLLAQARRARPGSANFTGESTAGHRSIKGQLMRIGIST